MIRTRISNFITNNKNRINDIGLKIIMVAIVVFIATIVISLNNTTTTDEEINNKSSYNPTSTVITGKNVQETKYEDNKNTIDIFIEYCNNKEVETAYSMLTDECKTNKYKSMQVFKETFIDIVFKNSRTYNLQSWINDSKYTTYKIRLLDDLLVTGNYNDSEKYETYITIYVDQLDKVTIGEYIYTEEINKSNTDNLVQATIIKKNIYADEEEYEIKFKNLTTNNILIDDLQDRTSIRLYGEDGNAYSPYYEKLYTTNLLIMPGETITIKVNFKKSMASENKSSKITFKKIILNYNQEEDTQENVNEFKEIDIKF